jgi:mono/diheme cytochrome c family protein
VIYGTNITPDPQTGIGQWSLAAFTRAMREGVSRDGHHLYAAFPYNAFTELSEDDINALYAYLMTRAPVNATIPPNTVPFPLNIRLLEEGWKILFFRKKTFQPDPAKNSEWNRGAYLSEAVSDCGGCHTPRNALGAEELRHAYAGAVVDHWIAPPLTDANPSPVPWTQEELFSYLRSGVGGLHGAAIAATMTPVVRDALDVPVVPDADVRALATYFSDINHASVHPADAGAVTRRAIERSALGSGQDYDPDVNLYAGACMSCHYNSGTTPLVARPELGLNSALMLPEPTNFIQPVLRGIGSKDGAPGLVMPAYASALTDGDVARPKAVVSVPVNPGKPGRHQRLPRLHLEGRQRRGARLRQPEVARRLQRHSRPDGQHRPPYLVGLSENHRDRSVLLQDRKMAGFCDLPDRRIHGFPGPTGDRKLSPLEEKSPNSSKYPRILPLLAGSEMFSHLVRNEWRAFSLSNSRWKKSSTESSNPRIAFEFSPQTPRRTGEALQYAKERTTASQAGFIPL